MAYAEPVDLNYSNSWMKDIYEKPKKIELSERELIVLRALALLGSKEATEKLAEYYLSNAIF